MATWVLKFIEQGQFRPPEERGGMFVQHKWKNEIYAAKLKINLYSIDSGPRADEKSVDDTPNGFCRVFKSPRACLQF